MSNFLFRNQFSKEISLFKILTTDWSSLLSSTLDIQTANHHVISESSFGGLFLYSILQTIFSCLGRGCPSLPSPALESKLDVGLKFHFIKQRFAPDILQSLSLFHFSLFYYSAREFWWIFTIFCLRCKWKELIERIS